MWFIHHFGVPLASFLDGVSVVKLAAPYHADCGIGGRLYWLRGPTRLTNDVKKPLLNKFWTQKILIILVSPKYPSRAGELLE